MDLDLTRYRKPLSTFARVFQPGEIGDEGEAYRVVAPVELEFELHKDKDRFRVVGKVRTELELACSRCVEPFRMTVDAPFDIRYLPVTEASTEADREVGADDLETSVYRDDRLDLNELLREQFYLVLPMKPLCVEDCRGLCPLCGINLNTGGCNCAPVWEDPRLAPLRQLKNRES